MTNYSEQTSTMELPANINSASLGRKIVLAAMRIFQRRATHLSVHHLNDHALADIGLERTLSHGAVEHYFDRVARGR